MTQAAQKIAIHMAEKEEARLQSCRDLAHLAQILVTTEPLLPGSSERVDSVRRHNKLVRNLESVPHDYWIDCDEFQRFVTETNKGNANFEIHSSSVTHDGMVNHVRSDTVRVKGAYKTHYTFYDRHSNASYY